MKVRNKNGWEGICEGEEGKKGDGRERIKMEKKVNGDKNQLLAPLTYSVVFIIPTDFLT